MAQAIVKLLLVSLLVTPVFLSACASPFSPEAASPPLSQTLGEYLRDMFQSQEIILDEDDFLEPVEDPYLSFAQMLNLIPSSHQSDQRITQRTAEQISEQFLSIKDKLLLDGLYGKIDMHEHYRAGAEIDEFLKVAGCLGISKILFLPTGDAPDNRGYKEHQEALLRDIKPQYPDKIIAFCTIYEADPEAAEIFEQCLHEGAEGLKLLGGHLYHYGEPLNSANMYKVYQKAAEYEVPVLIHADIMLIPELKEQVDQVYSDFPEVTFIHAHYCSTLAGGIHLDQCAELLDKHPNLYIDLSMGGAIKDFQRYFRQDLATVKDFVLTYQDRILFGSDTVLVRSIANDFDYLYQRMRCDIDLQQQEEYTCSFAEEADALQPGFNLDKEVLRKLYYENPKKVLKL